MSIEQEIIERLDVLIALSMPNANDESGTVSGLAHQVLELCNYENTTDDIVKITKKTKNHVNKELSKLRSDGRIKTVKRGERNVHIRI